MIDDVDPFQLVALVSKLMIMRAECGSGNVLYVVALLIKQLFVDLFSYPVSLLSIEDFDHNFVFFNAYIVSLHH